MQSNVTRPYSLGVCTTVVRSRIGWKAGERELTKEEKSNEDPDVIKVWHSHRRSMHELNHWMNKQAVTVGGWRLPFSHSYDVFG